MLVAMQMSGETLKHWPEIIKEASTSPLGIFALMILLLGTISLAWFSQEKRWVKILIFLVMVGAVVAYGMAVSSAASKASSDTVYRVRVTVLDLSGIPTDNARVWSSVGGEPLKVPGGWQFVIPQSNKPTDGRVTFYAAVENAFLTGSQEITLASDSSPAVKVPLTHSEAEKVGGIVEDDQQSALSDATVSVIGFPKEAQTTDNSGGFSLPAHAAIGQRVQLHAQRTGYQGSSPWCEAGESQCIIILEHGQVPKHLGKKPSAH